MTSLYGLPSHPNAPGTKQWIIIRKDLNMPPGKLAAQASHASMGALLQGAHVTATDEPHGSLSIPLDFDLECWLSGSFTKVALQVHSKDELEEIACKLEAAGLRVARIVDNGLTVFNGEQTFTCVGVGPHQSDKVKPILGHLQLYK
jgi:peptidyl-tRNA hydrolase, PTH2 family